MKKAAKDEAGALRDEISTDEITPLPSLVYFDERLADHAYIGVKAGDALPIGVNTTSLMLVSIDLSQ